MIRVHVICEGSTEEDFVREILAVYLNKKESKVLEYFQTRNLC